MLNDDFTKLQVGDLVFVYYQSSTCVKPVQKITPSGLIKVDGNLFNQNGCIRGGGSFCTTRIEIATPEKIEEFRQRVYIKKVYCKLKELSVDDITLEQAKEINRIFNFE